jgi:hypothetical protein
MDCWTGGIDQAHAIALDIGMRIIKAAILR